MFLLVIFLLTLLLVFGGQAKMSYDGVRVSRLWEFALCASTVVGVFSGLDLVYVNRYDILDYPDWNHPPLSTLGISELWLLYLIVGIFGGFIALAIALLLGDQGAGVGRAIRRGSVKRTSNYDLFREAENRLRQLVEQDSDEAIRLVRLFFGILPGDAQFEVLKSRNLGWTDPLADELADWLLDELDRLLSGEGEHPDVQLDSVRHLGALLLPRLVRHPLTAGALREREDHLARQVSSLQQEVNELGEAYASYTSKTEDLRVIAQSLQEISRLLGEDAPELHDEQ